MQKKISKKVIIAIIAVIVVLIFVFNAFTVVEAGHTGVIVTMGKVTESTLQEGLHLKIPFIQNIVMIDNRIVKLEVHTEGGEIVVTAKAYARSVEIRCGPDAVLEDNFFDMNAGTRRIRVLRGKAGDVKVRSVYQIR